MEKVLRSGHSIHKAMVKPLTLAVDSATLQYKQDFSQVGSLLVGRTKS